MLRRAKKKNEVPEWSVLCARCGYCNAVCPVHAELGWESASPRGRLSGLLSGADSATRSFQCTLCGACAAACPLELDLRHLWPERRRELVAAGHRPPFIPQLERAVREERNVFAFPNDERGEWVAYAGGDPARFQKERAEVYYFVGCLSSFSPAVQRIPQALMKLLEKAGVDFAIGGEEEWCCGFPLEAAGAPELARESREHNLAVLERLGARTVLFTCPSCLLEWQEHYPPPPGVRYRHAAQYLLELVREGRLRPGTLELSVVYHDPCDLRRGGGIYLEPRELLRQVTADLRELPSAALGGGCCGGGGDLEMFDPALAKKIALSLGREIQTTGAAGVVTACPQCQRMVREGLRGTAGGPEVLDLVEILLRAVEQGERGENR